MIKNSFDKSIFVTIDDRFTFEIIIGISKNIRDSVANFEWRENTTGASVKATIINILFANTKTFQYIGYNFTEY